MSLSSSSPESLVLKLKPSNPVTDTKRKFKYVEKLALLSRQKCNKGAHTVTESMVKALSTLTESSGL